jgi:hypothetical protein
MGSGDTPLEARAVLRAGEVFLLERFWVSTPGQTNAIAWCAPLLSMTCGDPEANGKSVPNGRPSQAGSCSSNCDCEGCYLKVLEYLLLFQVRIFLLNLVCVLIYWYNTKFNIDSIIF